MQKLTKNCDNQNTVTRTDAARHAMWVYYSICSRVILRKIENMWKWKAKAHCFQHSFFHISSFSVLILSFTDFHKFWSSGSTLNHVLGGLEPSWMPGRSFGMTLNLFWKHHFFMIFGENFDPKMTTELHALHIKYA